MQPGTYTELLAAILAAAALGFSIFVYLTSRADRNISERSAASSESSAQAACEAANEAKRANDMAEQIQRQSALDRERDRFGMDIFLTHRSGDARSGERQHFELRHRGSDVARRVTLTPPDPRYADRFSGLPVGETLTPGASWPFSMVASFAGLPDHLQLEWHDHAPRNIPLPGRAACRERTSEEIASGSEGRIARHHLQRFSKGAPLGDDATRMTPSIPFLTLVRLVSLASGGLLPNPPHGAAFWWSSRRVGRLARSVGHRTPVKGSRGRTSGPVAIGGIQVWTGPEILAPLDGVRWPALRLG